MSARRRHAVRRRRARALIDTGVWVVSLYLAALLRLGLDLDRFAEFNVMMLLPLVVVTQWIVGYMTGLYRGGQVYGSFDEVAALARTVAAATAVALVAVLVTPGDRPAPAGAVIGGGMIALLGMGSIRYAKRFFDDRRRREAAHDRERVIVFGAGQGGERAIRAMLLDPDSPYVPVALIDDDPEKANLSMMGVRVMGDRSRLADVARERGAGLVLVAVPSADAALVRELVELARAAEIGIRVLPSVRELLGSDIRVVDIREPNELDLLGRHQVETDLEGIAHYLRGRRVLVTGAGGSIGSELCRQIVAFDPAELIMVDRDESALHSVQLSIEGRALLDSPNLVLLDIRDRRRVARLFEERRPDVVFHAAALKHLPLLESHPIEALKTNVWGTLSVLDAAAASGVSTFVNVSTDKAANPCSNLGYSKRIAERLTAFVAGQTDGTFLSVRFGNVLGSRGSVLTAFRSQVEAGGPLTVTHPDVTRFFMTVEEAVQLVIQAGAIGADGQALVLEMGEPVRIADVARRFASSVQPEVSIEFTGLRRGEKLHEELFAESEIGMPSPHPLISYVEVPPLDPAEVRDLDPVAPEDQIAAVLASLCSPGDTVDVAAAEA